MSFNGVYIYLFRSHVDTFDIKYICFVFNIFFFIFLSLFFSTSWDQCFLVFG